MTAVAPPRESPASSRARRVVLGALGLGLVFEVVNLLGTQDKTVYRAMPWHDDPHHAAVLAGRRGATCPRVSDGSGGAQ